MPELTRTGNIAWVFLDFDNTIWDFDANAEEALLELFHRHHLHLKTGFHSSDFIKLYKEINQQFWRDYEKGNISKDFLRTERFTKTFLEMGMPVEEHPENAWHEYLSICPTLTRLMPGALEFLDELSSRYPLAVITNGFRQTQQGKIQSCGLEKYFKFVLDSESTGVAKPSPEIFKQALKKAEIQTEEAVYIGDTWETDILGALGAGIPAIWYNHSALDPKLKTTTSSHYMGSILQLSEALPLIETH